LNLCSYTVKPTVTSRAAETAASANKDSSLEEERRKCAEFLTTVSILHSLLISGLKISPEHLFGTRK
jgi:hypothetical protein